MNLVQFTTGPPLRLGSFIIPGQQAMNLYPIIMNKMLLFSSYPHQQIDRFLEAWRSARTQFIKLI